MVMIKGKKAGICDDLLSTDSLWSLVSIFFCCKLPPSSVYTDKGNPTSQFDKISGGGGGGGRTYKMSQCMRFPTMWYVCLAKAQISLQIRAVWSEPLLFAYSMSVKLMTKHFFGGSKLKRRLHMLFWVYTFQNAAFLEITCHGWNDKD